jgi:hypothetical protein
MTAATHAAAGGTAGRDPFAVNEDNALEALTLQWGAWYGFAAGGGMLYARSRDQRHKLLDAETPDELTVKLLADRGLR